MRSLKINISWTLAGNLAFSAAQWLVIILITKLLGITELGHYAYGLALVSPLFLFTNLSLRSIQSTDTHNKYSFTDFFVFRCFSLFIACTACVLFIYFSNIESKQSMVIALLAVLKVSESLSEVYFGMFQKNERMDLISRSLITRSVLSILFATLSLLFYKQVELAIASLIIAYTLVLVFHDSRLLGLVVRIQPSKLVNKFRSKFYVLLITTLPLGVTVAVNVLYQSIPRFLIEQHHGASALGVFAGVSYFIVIGSTVVNAIGQSSLPRLARYIQQHNGPQFISLLVRLIVLSGGIGLAGVFFAYLFADPFLAIVYSKDFIGQRQLFVVIMLMAAVVYISGILGCALTAMQQFKCQAYISTICVVFLAALSIFYIPEYAALGAAYCMVGAYFFKMFLEAVCVVYYYSNGGSFSMVNK